MQAGDYIIQRSSEPSDIIVVARDAVAKEAEKSVIETPPVVPEPVSTNLL